MGGVVVFDDDDDKAIAETRVGDARRVFTLIFCLFISYQCQ